MYSNFIKIKGAKIHNLKNISVDIPKNKLVVITGISGSGKSSLAFDTLYAEGQRRYVESLSPYARQFLGIMQKPDVDKIEGISPAISIDQRKAAHNPRSTVGTITEIYDYLRLLFARIGVAHCPKCRNPITRQTVTQITDQILKLPRNPEILVLGPAIRGRKGEHKGVLEEIQRAGFIRVRIDGIVHLIEEALAIDLNPKKNHNIEVVVDRLIIEKSIDRTRLADSIETALKLGKGVLMINSKNEDVLFSEHFACEECGISLPQIEPRLFSFNSPYGACSFCQGLGEKLEVDPKLVLPNKSLTIAEGAIFPWSRASHKIGRQGYFFWQLSKLAQRHDFSLDVPVRDLPKQTIDLILYGDQNFEGVVRNLERRYHETDSDWTRQEIEQYMIIKKCPKCLGKRLKPEVLAVKIAQKSIDQIVETNVEDLKRFFGEMLEQKSFILKSEEIKIAHPIFKEIINRLQFLSDVGLDYLTLDRKAATLSEGEEQRIRLATQLGSKLTGVLYVLDEPSIGLHSRDQRKLIATLKNLRDLGNTVVVVEHDSATILEADWVIDIGPGAGKHGGNLTFEGTPKQLLKSKSLTGQYLSGKKKVEIEEKEKIELEKIKNQNNKTPQFLVIKGARENNLKNITASIPLKKMVCIAGVSGSGKSSLITDTLARALFKKFYKSKEEPGKYDEILGLEHLDKVVLVDQSPIGRTPRSNSVTYTGAFSYIRYIFSKVKEARVRGYKSGRFSFNIKGGRCEACEGQGVKKIEMYFLPDVYVECQECRGARYNKETLEIEYKGRNIAQVLEMTIEDALEFFKNIPPLFQKFNTLKEVGLGYVGLGQPAPSLSGGEAQRIKLATELSKKATGKTLYILDEPTTGLHFEDIKKLLLVLKRLVAKGNTILTIEHNLDVIKNADWILDLGPEGGEKGGYIVAQGSPQEIVKNKESYTGKYLKPLL